MVSIYRKHGMLAFYMATMLLFAGALMVFPMNALASEAEEDAAAECAEIAADLEEARMMMDAEEVGDLEADLAECEEDLADAEEDLAEDLPEDPMVEEEVDEEDVDEEV